MGQSLQPSQNEKSQCLGAFPPGSCSERQAPSGEAPKAVLCEHKLNHLHHTDSFSMLYHNNNRVPRRMHRRKRRAINFDEFKPSQMKEDVVQSSMEEKGSDRKGRFLLYWITTTSISTSTSFTSTFSVYSVFCTPSGVNECG